MKSLDQLASIESFDLDGKVVFLRLDLNVPIIDGQITDTTRIDAALPTIRYALDNGAKLVAASHMGRPKTEEDREKLSLEPVAKALGDKLNIEVMLVDDVRSDAPHQLLRNIKSNQMILLENLRFDKDETKNGEAMAECISQYTDIYINDAFGASHRAHSSIVQLPSLLKQKGMGFLMRQEIEMLQKILNHDGGSFVNILGGAKVSDKIGVIENLVDQVDCFIVGGAMAYTFLAAQEISVGNSLVETEKLNFARQLIDRLKMREKKLLLPVDHLVVTSITSPETAKSTESASIEDGWLGVDIGPKTIELFSKEISSAATVLWNGPMGIFETPEYAKGSFAIAKALADSSASSIVGGGDSAAAAKASGVADKLTHISTGGGASLEFLQGDVLPGLRALGE